MELPEAMRGLSYLRMTKVESAGETSYSCVVGRTEGAEEVKTRTPTILTTVGEDNIVLQVVLCKHQNCKVVRSL